MDNKENRKFYWEIKDFMGNADAKPQASTPKQSTVVNAVKNILEKRNVYKQETFSPNINSNNTLSQVLMSMEKFKKEGDPNCVGYSKNIHRNAFGLIREQQESVFDTLLRQGSVKSTNNIDDINPMATADELANIIDQEEVQPGVPLSQRQKMLRDMEAKARAKENLQKAKEEQAQQASGLTPEEYAEVQKQKDTEGFKNADRAAVEKGDITADEYTQRYGEAPQASNPNAPGGVQRNTQAPQPTQTPATQPSTAVAGVDVEGPPVPSAEEERMAAAEAQKQKEKEQAAPVKVDPQQAEKDKFKETQTKSWERRNLQKRQAAEQQLAALNAGDESKMSDSIRARRAANRVRLQQEIEGSADLSKEEISRRVESSARTRFATPEEKAARELEKSEKEVSMYSGYKSDGSDPERDARMAAALKKAQSNVQRLKGGQSTGAQTATTPTPASAPKPTATTPTPSSAPKPTATTPTPSPTSGPRGTAMDVGNNAQAMSGARDRQAQSMFGGTTTPTKPGSSSPIPVPGNSSQTTRPAQQTGGMGSLNTGGSVNTSARGLLGMGNQPETQKEPTSGESAARETLGMGKPQPKPNQEKEKKVAGLQA